MPTYDYNCTLCGENHEIFHGINESAKTLCPNCGKLGLKKCISNGAGIVFKGSGFYQTDYKRPPEDKCASTPKENSKSPPTTHSCGASCGC